MWRPIAYEAVQTFGAPGQGVVHKENRRHANFRRPGNDTPNLGVYQDDENQREIDFLYDQPPKALFHPFALLKTSSAPKYGGRTPSITYLQPPPVFVQTHQNSCVVHKHAFG